MKKLAYWFSSDGSDIRVDENCAAPTMERMQKHLGGYFEHVSVLFHGVAAHMYVHETGRYNYEERNEPATMIYFAATRLRGKDPEDPNVKRQATEEMARRMNIPLENIQYLGEGDGKPDGIYGPAILLVGFKDEEL